MRGQNILDWIAAHPGESFTADEIADRMGMVRGTVSGSCSTLVSAGLLTYSGSPRRYQVAPNPPPTPAPRRWVVTDHQPAPEWVSGFRAGWVEALRWKEEQ